MAAPPSLVGRDAELTFARSLLAKPPEDGAVLVLGGQPGVGKTALARALAEDWTATGGDLLWLAGAAGLAEVPFGAVARLLPDVRPADDAPVAGRDADVIAGAVRAARAAPHRLVVVDDAHSLDVRSAAMIQALVLDRSVRMIVTVRSGEPVHPVLEALWRDQHAPRIDLQPLSIDEVDAVVVATLGGAIDPTTGAALFEVTKGNPLLLRETLRDATDAGALTQSEGSWRWSGAIGRGRHLHDVIGRRLDALDDGHRRMVLVLALGGALAPDVARAVAGVDLVEAEDRGTVVPDDAEGALRVRLAHPLLGEVLLERLDRREVDAARLQLADALGRSSSGIADVLLEARLRLAAGDRARPDRFEAAAAIALTLGASDVALRLARAAADLGAGTRAHLLVAESLWLCGEVDAAAAALDAVVESANTDAARVRAALDLQLLHQGQGRPDRIDAVYERARPLIDDPTWAAVLEGNAIQAEMLHGSTAAATSRAEALLAAHDDPIVRLRLVSSVGSGRALEGRTDDALAFIAEMLPHALQLQDQLPLAPAWVVAAQAQALLFAGRMEEADGLIAAVRAVVASTGAYAAGLLADLYAARVDLAVGRAADAAARLEEVVGGLRSFDPGGVGPWAASLRGEALAVCGDLDGARESIDGIAQRPVGMPAYEGDAARARAWVLALGGEVSRATTALLDTAASMRADRQHALELQVLHDAVRLGAVHEAGDHLVVAAAAVDGLWPAPMRLHVDGLRAGSGPVLIEAGEAFAAIGARLHAAEALAEAGRAFADAGTRARAAAALRRRDDLLDGLGPISTPALLEAPVRAKLTRREREVVLLAAQGLSNKAIAERLVVSVRTAEGHLLRAFAKLGVSDRAELASAIRELA